MKIIKRMQTKKEQKKHSCCGCIFADKNTHISNCEEMFGTFFCENSPTSVYDTECDIIQVRPVKTNNSVYEQIEKINQEYNELHEAIMTGESDERIAEEACDVAETCFTLMDIAGVDIGEAWKRHNEKMESRGWKERG